jgi:hypothetical protein
VGYKVRTECCQIRLQLHDSTGCPFIIKPASVAILDQSVWITRNQPATITHPCSFLTPPEHQHCTMSSSSQTSHSAQTPIGAHVQKITVQSQPDPHPLVWVVRGHTADGRVIVESLQEPSLRIGVRPETLPLPLVLSRPLPSTTMNPIMAESIPDPSAWYRAVQQNVIGAWQAEAPGDWCEYCVVVPEVGDWLKVLPCNCSGGICMCDGWRHVRLSRSAIELKGWVPGWLISQGCKCYYSPVVVPPPTPPPIPPASIPEIASPLPQPPAWIITCPSMDPNFGEHLRSLTSNSGWRMWRYKAALYCDTFDKPGETPTSELLPCIDFPTPSLTGPLPVEPFEYIDPKEWMAFDLSTHTDMKFEEGARMGDHWTESENMSQMRLFHGTVLGAAYGMIDAGGFIPGTGRCRKNSRKVRGAFCSTSFAEALEKGLGHQLDYAEDALDGNKRLTMCCMPVVVELKAVDWRPTRMHSTKYCFEAPDGFTGQLPGVIIATLFVNRVLAENFQQHEPPRLGPELADPYLVRVCGQSISKFTVPLRQATCGRILYANDPDSIVQSNKKIWYCRACAEFRVYSKTMYVYSLPGKESCNASCI